MPSAWIKSTSKRIGGNEI